MTYFTENSLERLMQQKPDGPQPVMPAPRGELCNGCHHYGPGCLIACVRKAGTASEGKKVRDEAGDR